MANKYYAIRKGKKRGVFLTWNECKKYVDGFHGAEYKSFQTMEEAQAFVGNNIVGIDRVAENLKKLENALVAYVDGSYNNVTKEFSYGMVLITDEEEFLFSHKVDDKQLAQMHNVAGEIKGSEAAMKYAIENGYHKLVIYHDYEGISKWCLGEWKANKEGTKAYKAFYDSIKDNLEVHFIKVKGHSHDKYNDMADKLAKKAIGIMS